MSNISDNIEVVRRKINEAALRAGRNPDEITLIAVSKTVGKEEILDAYENAGQMVFGENRVQDLVSKYDENFKWHLIGHLQKNKIKYVIDKTCLIHSVDSVELMDELERYALKFSVQVDFLLQVNVSGEKSKFGVRPDEIFEIVTKMSQYRNIRLKGLMTMAPNITDVDKVRGIFKLLSSIYIDINSENYHNVSMQYLSMGMSNDYEVAIEEGANLVRVGTAIFTKV